MTRSRLPAIDALRGLAAIGVMVYHYSIPAHFLDSRFPTIAIGAACVELFFVISGYVILMTAQRSTSRWDFAWARFVRLAPAFVFCLCVSTAFILAAGARFSLGTWLLNLTMVPGWFGARMVETVYWTLGYEVAFYVVVWVSLPLIRRGWTLWLCLAALPVLLWQPVVAYFILGVVLYELQISVSRAESPDCRQRAIAWRRKIGNCARAVRVGPLCLWLGAVSYPLYLIHCNIGQSFVLALAPTVGVLPALGLTCATMLALATAINRLVEVPIQAGLKRWHESGFALVQPIVIPEMF